MVQSESVMLWLRIAYRAGAVFDALMIVPMLFPDIGGALFGIAGFHPKADYRYAMMIGATLMCGWTCLLVWADRRTLERRGVLLLTVFPVLCGLLAGSVYAVTAQLVRPARMAPTIFLQLCLGALFCVAYGKAAHLTAAARPAPDYSPGRQH